MKIFTVMKERALKPLQGRSVVAEFEDGKILELTDSQQPLPPAIPDGMTIWGGREPSEHAPAMKHAQLNITSVAANGIIVAPCRENVMSPIKMELFISEDSGHLIPLTSKNVVIELNNGKTLEVVEDYAKKGLLIWGGREPVSGLTLNEAKERTESLGIYPLAANMIHVFAYRLG
ncbi:hypothetical protein AB1287_12335 [Enterobacter asburiae]|uniref:hypothetical protein n=1 Tax=Scandinavium sp. UTDF21-P1B TaxID=3446379 RepID=UPI00346FAA24